MLVLTFIVGAGAGALISHLLKSGSAGNNTSSDLKTRMNEKELQLAQLSDNVSEHFVRTDELVSTLEKNYEALISHLKSGTESFCDDSTLIKKPVVETAAEKKEAEPEEQTESEPPRDYAPKTSGTLSEDFGLNKEKEESTEPPKGL
nr:DUF1043 family protein [Oceanospirillum sediminis]